MGIQFPIAPLHGAQFTPAGIPVTWQYDSGRNAWRVVRGGTAWTDITGKPATFPPSEHDHEIDDVTGLQDILDLKQDITARGLANGYAPLDETGKVPENMISFGALAWDNIEGKPGVFPPEPHSHPVVEISDSSSVGQQLVRAPTPFAAREVIGAIGVDDNARVAVDRNDVLVGTRRNINFKEGSNITLSVVDDAINEEVEVTINAAGGAADAATYIVSETKPIAPFDKTVWLDLATGIQFTYYNDGTTSQWIEAIPFLAAMPGAFTKIIFPVAPSDGQVYEPISGARWKWSTSRGVWFAVTSVSDAYTKVESDAKYVDNAGDTMTGALTLSGNPTAALQAATKQYVDVVQTSANTKVAKAGDTMTGHLVLPTGPAASNAVRKDYVDAADAALTNDKVAKIGDTMTGHLTLPTGPAAANAVRKDYVDAADATLAAVDAALATDVSGKVSKAGDTMTGALSAPSFQATGNYGYMSVHGGPGSGSDIYGYNNNKARWLLRLGNGEAESGGNVGGNFNIVRYADDGTTTLGTAVSIQRSNGAATFFTDLRVQRPSPDEAHGLIHFGNGGSNYIYSVGNKFFLNNSTDVAGHLTLNGDVCAGNGTANVGVYRFGNNGTCYIYCNGSTYSFGGLPITAPALQTTGSILAGTHVQANAGLYGTAAYGCQILGTTGTSPYIVHLVHGDPQAGGCYFQLLHYSGSFVTFRMTLSGYGANFDFRQDGQAYKLGGGAWGDISDARIKNILGDYGSGLDAVAALRPVRYTFKGNDTYAEPSYYSDTEKLNEDGTMKAAPTKEALAAPYPNSFHYKAATAQTEYIGLIAQEVEATMPEMVTQNKGFIDGIEVTDLRDLDTGPLVFALINAVKELKGINEALTARVAALEAV